MDEKNERELAPVSQEPNIPNRREYFMQKLEAKAEAISGLRRIIDDSRPEDTIEVTEQRLGEYQQKITKSLFDGNHLKTDEDAQFLGSMNGTIVQLYDNHKKVGEMVRDHGLFLMNIENAIRNSTPSEKPFVMLDLSKARISFKGFAVVMHIEDEHFGEIFDTLDTSPTGVHIRDYPFVFVRKRSSEKELLEKNTERHELTHLYLQGSGKEVNAICGYENVLSEYKRSVEMGNSDREATYRNMFLKLTPQKVLDNVRGEILPDLQKFEFVASEYRADVKLRLGESASVEDKYENYKIQFSTSTLLIDNFLESIQEKGREITDQAVRVHLQELVGKMKFEYVRFIDTPTDIYEFARAKGPQVFEQTESMLFMIPPSKYGVILSYLKAKYSDEKA